MRRLAAGSWLVVGIVTASSSGAGHRTPMLAMNAAAFSYSAAVIPLLA